MQWKLSVFSILVVLLAPVVIPNVASETITTSNDVSSIEPIPITFSHDREDVIFDGKWTHLVEWKRSTLTGINYDDGMQIKLRTAHQGEFIYVLVDFITDTHVEKGMDMSIICIDGNNDKSDFVDENDFCFSSVMYSNNEFIHQGNSNINTLSNLKKITHSDFISIASISDEHDRYTKTPHASYEFKIPIELFGRSNNYGFYLYVYDSYNDQIYTWPPNISVNKIHKIPSPELWGNVISPDKSLPEFNLMFLVFSSVLVSVIILTKFPFSNKFNF